MGEIADWYVDRMIDQGLNPERMLRGSRRKRPPCPTCGGRPKERQTEYGVKRECCGLWAWGKNSPLVDAGTHKARSYAHKVFDSLWQSGLISRSRAYALLAQELGLHPDECHMKTMDRQTADRVPAATYNIGKRLKGTPT